MACKLRLDCFLLYASQQNGGFFHACYISGHMQGTLICLVHVSCHKTCGRSAEYYHLLISSFPPFFLKGKNFPFFFSTALISCRFCICFNWLWVASAARAVSRALFSVKSGTRSKSSLTLLSAIPNTMLSRITESFNS